MCRFPPNNGQKKRKQFHKEAHNKHVNASGTTSFTQSRSDVICYSGTASQQEGRPIYSPSIPQPLQCTTSFQGYCATYTPPILSAHPITVQNNSGGSFSVSVLNTVALPLQYPPIHPPQVPAHSPLLPHPPGIPFHYTPPNCYPSSSGLALPPTTQLQPQPIASEIQHNYSST